MHLIQKLSGGDYRSLSDEELRALLHEVTFRPTNFAHLAPMLKAELDFRRSEKLNKLILYVSIATLVAAIGSIIQGWWK